MFAKILEPLRNRFSPDTSAHYRLKEEKVQWAADAAPLALSTFSYYMASGSLACTSKRVVYQRGRHTIDFSLEAINDIEYVGPGVRSWETHHGMKWLLAAGFVWLQSFWLDPLALYIDIISAAIAILALLTIGAAITDQKSVVKLHTPTGTYSFRGDDHDELARLPHAVRTLQSKRPKTVSN